MTGAAGAISARRSWAWREKMRSFGRQFLPRRGSCDDLNVAIATASVTPAKRAKSFPESKERGIEKGPRAGRSRRADSRGVWRSVYEPRWLEEGLAETSGDNERRPHGAIRGEMGWRDDTAQRAADAGAAAGREGCARYQLLRHNSLPCSCSSQKVSPSLPRRASAMHGDSSAERPARSFAGAKEQLPSSSSSSQHRRAPSLLVIPPFLPSCLPSPSPVSSPCRTAPSTPPPPTPVLRGDSASPSECSPTDGCRNGDYSPAASAESSGGRQSSGAKRADGRITHRTSHSSLPLRASIMATPRLTARPPSPFVPAGKSGLCCKCHVARVYALMVFVSLLALLLFLFVPWAASHGAIRATAGDAVAVAEAGTGGRVRGRGRGPQLERGESLHFGGNAGSAESAMRMGGEQADVIQEKAVTMADVADAVASSEAAFKGDEALAGRTGAAEEMEEGAERGTDGGEAEEKGEGGQGGEGGEGEEGGGGEGEVPMPLRVYMLPLTGELNFHVLLQRWRFANRLQVQLRHGMPADWQFNGNSLRPRAHGDVVGLMVQDDGWMEGGQGEGGEGGGGGGEGSVQVPQFVEGFGVHIEQYAAEYWLTLSLLAGGLPSLQRVRRAEDAHIIFVPAFSSAFYATQMKTNERRRRAGDTRIPEEQHLLAAVTQHALWGDRGGQGGGASQGAKGQQGEGELLEKVQVAAGEGSPGGGGGDEEAGGSSRRRLLRVLKGGRKGKEAEAGEQAQNAPVEDQQGPDGGAGGAERADAAERSQSEGAKRGLVFRRRDFLIPAVHPHALSTVRHEVAAAHMLMVDLSQPAEQVAHLDKDVLVPYSALIPPFLNDSLPGETEGGHGSAGGAQAVAAWGAARPTLIFFRGTLNRQQALALRPGYVETFLRNVSHESAFVMWQRLREVCGDGMGLP
ncbi:unnamed protein product [Closterium sp. NIES-54]